MVQALRFPAAVVAGTVLLLLPALLNGGPFFYYDTGYYIRNGGHLMSPLLNGQFGPVPEAWWSGLVLATSRSPIYGVPLWAAQEVGALGLMVLIQCAAGAWAVLALTRAALGACYALPGLAILAGIALVAPMGVFAGLLMPDIWAGLGVLALALLAVYWRGLGWFDRALAAAIIAFSVASHTSHLLLYGVLIPGLALALALPAARRAGLSGAGLASAAAALVLGVLTTAGAIKAIETFTGTPGRGLPHLTAHLIDDGPGVAFVAEHCATAEFAICDHPELVPMDWIQFLFFPGAHIDEPTRDRFVAEDTGFLLAVLQAYPVRTSAYLVGDGLAQLVTLDASDILLTAIDDRAFALRPDAQAVVRAGLFYDAPERLRWVTAGGWIGLLAGLAALGLAARQARQGGQPPGADPVVLVALICLAAVILNGLICGAAAGPYGRFQLRLIWLLPFAGALALMAVRAPAPARAPAP